MTERCSIGPYVVVLQNNGKVMVFKNREFMRELSKSWDDYRVAVRYYDKLCEKLESENI